MNKKVNKLKIIFLNIDGVLCTLRSHYAFGTGMLMKEWNVTACHIINRLCGANGYQIVCSSSWRFDPNTLNFFKDYGLFKYLHKDWRTGPDRTSRGREIQEWIDNHNVDEYIIIDDNNDMLPEQQERLIKSSTADGFSSENLILADKLMGSNFIKLTEN
jgi:hypothetical protein